MTEGVSAEAFAQEINFLDYIGRVEVIRARDEAVRRRALDDAIAAIRSVDAPTESTDANIGVAIGLVQAEKAVDAIPVAPAPTQGGDVVRELRERIEGRLRAQLHPAATAAFGMVLVWLTELDSLTAKGGEGRG